jgi:hypothetical protein
MASLSDFAISMICGVTLLYSSASTNDLSIADLLQFVEQALNAKARVT